jgi:hypothetical protein
VRAIRPIEDSTKWRMALAKDEPRRGGRSLGEIGLASVSNLRAPSARSFLEVRPLRQRGPRYGASSSLPEVLRDSSSVCASAALASGSTASMLSLSQPSRKPIIKNSARRSSSARVPMKLLSIAPLAVSNRPVSAALGLNGSFGPLAAPYTTSFGAVSQR